MNILILTDKYFPKPFANVICAQNLAESLVSMNQNVHILAYKDSGIKNESPNKQIPVYYIKPDLRLSAKYYSSNLPEKALSNLLKNFSIMLNRIRRAIYLPFYPLYSFLFPKRMLKYVKNLNSKFSYDVIISVFAPFENALTAKWFKEQNQNTVWILYTVDTFSPDPNFLKKKGITHSYWLPKFLDNCDQFIYMRSREDEYASEYFDKWRSKMFVSDIPLLTNALVTCPERSKNEVEQWIYAGSLVPPHYIVDDLIRIFLKLNDGRKRELHFYSSEKVSGKANKLEQGNSKIFFHKYINHDKLIELYKNADVLVGIKYSDQISAKTLEYISFGKKFVHVSGTIDDPNVLYVKNYSKGIVISPYKQSDDECVTILQKELYSSDKRDNNVEFFRMNRPEYTANLICEFISHFSK